MAEHSDEIIVGIDLGTTNSVIAVLSESSGEPITIPNAEGSTKTPSIVAFTEDGEVLVGEIARRQIATNPTCTVTGVKRLMGKYYSDIEESDEHFPFEITSDEDQILINIRGIGYTPQQISALILKKLKDSAEAYLGRPVSKAVITVPANFDDLQREATIEAGRLAGLDVVRLINEPTAAAMAYGLGRGQEEIIAVYDFGGGTFDISILEVSRNAFEVLTTGGDSHLGGDDIDNLMVELLAAEFEKQHGVNLLSDPLTYRRLKDAAEKAKCDLSAAEHTLINIPFVAYKGQVPLHLERRFSRAEFEKLVEPIVARTIACCRETLKDAGLKKDDIDKVILVGGSSRIPFVQDAVAEFFDIEPFKGVNPDEVVALGAATQGGVMSGHLEEVVLLDVTPHSLGIEVKNNKVSRIVEKNSTIPIKAAKTFTTTEDNQEFVHIHVLQGEEPEANRNRSLGRFTLSGIEPAPAGVPRIRVTFFINADGVVEVSATDLQSGREKTLTVAHSFLTDEQYRAARRAAAREARRRHRRAAATRRRPTEILQGKVLAPEKAAPKPSGEKGETPVPVQDTGFREVEDTARVEERVASPAAAVEGPHGARVAQSVMKPPKLTAPPKSLESGTWTPSVEAISRQADQMSDHPEGDTLAEEPIAVSKEKPEVAPPAEEQVAATPGEPAKEAAPEAEVAEAPAKEAPITFSDLVAEKWPEAPRVVREAAEFLDTNPEGEEASETFKKALGECEKVLGSNPEEIAPKALAAAIQIELRDPEAANLLVEQIAREQDRWAEDLSLQLYTRLIEKYPQYVPALQARGRIYHKRGDLEHAVADLEAAVSRETSDQETLQLLEQIYNAVLEKSPSPTLEFKLVKLYLKMSRLDNAISILQRLVNNPNYEQRALKILGLCFWQKNMYYLAWQKFKQLPVTDDIKDILYRLACDMEAADQLTNAKYALERIMESDINYKDVEARLKRINHRLRVQQEELAQTKIPASAEVLQDMRFVILDEINRGSMGVVYRARDKVLDEIVALKVLNDYLCADPQAVQRFKREARAAKRLSHPNIVRIHEFYESGGKKFISMEYIEGRDLKKILLEEGRLSVEKIKKYFIQMCRALQYAHELNIVHRDIKPANVMITNNDVVKITDFGIAKILKTEDATSSSSMILGTPLYMAPEQIEGGEVDGRCDIYSLGVMLYEAASGHPPFTDGNIEYHHVHTPVPPLPDDIPESLKTVIYKAVEKRPESRFQTPAELLEALEKVEEE